MDGGSCVLLGAVEADGVIIGRYLRGVFLYFYKSIKVRLDWLPVIYDDEIKAVTQSHHPANSKSPSS